MYKNFAWSLLAIVALGCGASPAGDKAVTAANGKKQAGEAPAHEFKPQSHPARSHQPPPPPPPLRTLPALVDNSSECFPQLRHQERWRGPPPTGSSAFGRGGGSGGSARGMGGLAHKERRPMKKPKPSSPSRPAMAPPPPASPAPAPAAEPPAAVAQSKRDRSPSGGEGFSMADEDAESKNGAAEIATDSPSDGATVAQGDSQFNDWGAATYLSNDDTMSLSSAQRVNYAIDNFLPLPIEHVRPHELLNYFSFQNKTVNESDDFAVLGGIAPKANENGIYTLALGVSGYPVTKQSRRNVNISFVIDRSGSMQAEGRMEYLKRGLLRMSDELKRGDIVHMTLFDHRACSALENFVVGRDPQDTLLRTIRMLRPMGSTDLHAGLTKGYDVTDKAYQPAYSNRVVMITDAETNTGVTDSRLISTISKFYDSRRIRLSGVGVGRTFNDALLDRLTERGKGAYVFLGSEAEVDAVFGSRFVSLVETSANDVHFRLHLPPSMRLNVFYGEEASTVKEDIQAIHYSANTSQLFLSDLMAKGGKIRPQDEIMLTIEYEHPESGKKMVEEYAFNLGDLLDKPANVQKGTFVMRFIDGLAEIAARPHPSRFGRRAGSWDDSGAFELCDAGRTDLAKLSEGLENDPEVRRITGLWEKYCARFERPRGALRRHETPPADAWPGATDVTKPRR